MDEIMEKNLKTFAAWFMKQQQDYEEKIQEVEVLKKQIYDLTMLIDYAYKLIYGTTDETTDKERVELIWKAIDELYDKWNVWEKVDLDE